MQVSTVSISWLFCLEKGLSHMACPASGHIPIPGTWCFWKHVYPGNWHSGNLCKWEVTLKLCANGISGSLENTLESLLPKTKNESNLRYFQLPANMPEPNTCPAQMDMGRIAVEWLNERWPPCFSPGHLAYPQDNVWEPEIGKVAFQIRQGTNVKDPGGAISGPEE